MIPKVLIQFWHDYEDIPDVVTKAMAVTHSNHDDYKIIKADDDFMYDFIKNHYSEALLNLYKRNRIPASRADISRLLLLYAYGGFYLDATMEFTGTLNKFIDNVSDVILVLRDDVSGYKKAPLKAHAINGILGVPVKSPFIKWCIQRVIRHLISGEHNKRVAIATGPAVINQALEKFEDTYKIKKLSFTSLSKDFLIHRRVSGVTNEWSYLQRDGFIEPSYYHQNGKQFEKSWIFRNIMFHISFNCLYVKPQKK